MEKATSGDLEGGWQALPLTKAFRAFYFFKCAFKFVFEHNGRSKHAIQGQPYPENLMLVTA